MTSYKKQQTGIYGIYCAANGKWYVGQAANIRRRNQEELRDLNAGKSHKAHLQNAWNLYGPDAFVWLTLEVCDLEELDQKETHWVEQLDSFRSGFNKTLGGRGARGYRHTEAQKQHLREINSGGRNPRCGRPISEEAKSRMRANALGGNSPRAKAVLQLSLDGRILQEFASISDAARATGTVGSHIGGVCSGRPKRKTAGGYRWAWKGAEA